MRLLIAKEQLIKKKENYIDTQFHLSKLFHSFHF